jgi:mono/diheme cytochrome c family protein
LIRATCVSLGEACHAHPYSGRSQMRSSRFIAALLAALIPLGCGGSSDGVTTAPPPPTTNTVIPPEGATVAMVAEGNGIFNNGSCKSCHGIGGKNGPYGPNLTDAVWLQIDGSYASIVGLVTTGVPPEKFKSPTSQATFWMFPRGGLNLNDAQVKSVSAYVWTLSHPNG